MLYFSEREKLADLYYKWRKENNVFDCAASVISFLVGYKLIDCDAAKEYIHKNEVSKMTKEKAFEVVKYLSDCEDVSPYHKEALSTLLNDYERIIDEVSNKTGWIPVSERMPEDFQRVLVTIVNYNGDKVVRVAEYYNRVFQIKENYEEWKVGEKGLLAWRLLPEPYRAESEE